MAELFQKLEEYAQSDYYPYHMPGHKRRLAGNVLAQAARWDITEIDGFDNLHAAEDILKRMQEKAAKVYGAEESHFLVNGSTAGILSAISAAVPQHGKLLMTRGCHKAAYHAAYLRNLEIQYLYPGVHPQFGCNLPVKAEEISQALEADSEIDAVCIVSPTYEGLIADVAEIAKVVHEKGIPLIVDEAHGAHLGFHPAWPKSSVTQGADIVIQSLHKTLPAPTQTAILHVNGDRINRKELQKYLRIFQTSSPSYLFLAAMEEAIEITSSNAQKLFGTFLQNWTKMCDMLNACEYLAFLQEPGMDIGKLVIADKSNTFSGQQLYEKLLHQYHLQPEMAAGNYVLVMFTIGDTEEGYQRLTEALLAIDKECLGQAETQKAANMPTAGILGMETHCVTGKSDVQTFKTQLQKLQSPPTQHSLWESWGQETEEIDLEEAEGCIAGDFINLYPPGIPLIVPGEVVTKELCGYIKTCIQTGLNVQGVTQEAGVVMITVLKD